MANGLNDHQIAALKQVLEREPLKLYGNPPITPGMLRDARAILDKNPVPAHVEAFTLRDADTGEVLGISEGEFR